MSENYRISNYGELKQAQTRLKLSVDAQKLKLNQDFVVLKHKYSYTNLSEMVKSSFFDNRSELNQMDYIEVGSHSLIDTLVGSIVKGRSPIIRLVTQTAANLLLKKSSKTLGTTIYKLFSKFTS